MADTPTDVGRVGCAETGSHATHEAPSGLRPSGFDPARGTFERYKEGLCDTGCNALSICACSAIEELAEEVDALRQIVADLGYCVPHASLEFMRRIPAEVRATRAKLALLRPRNYSDSTMVPAELWELLEQVWVIADNYDLREAIEAHPVHKDNLPDSFMWRDCMEAINAIATEARRAETAKTGSVHEGAGRRHRPKTATQKEGF